jgi:hypothetical protein
MFFYLSGLTLTQSVDNGEGKSEKSLLNNLMKRHIKSGLPTYTAVELFPLSMW